jgi:hypothetical protein
MIGPMSGGASNVVRPSCICEYEGYQLGTGQTNLKHVIIGPAGEGGGDRGQGVNVTVYYHDDCPFVLLQCD